MTAFIQPPRAIHLTRSEETISFNIIEHLNRVSVSKVMMSTVVDKLRSGGPNKTESAFSGYEKNYKL